MDGDLGPVAWLPSVVGTSLYLPTTHQLLPVLALHTPSALYLCLSGPFVGGQQSLDLMGCLLPPRIDLVSAFIDSARFHTCPGCDPGPTPANLHEH